MGFDDSDWSAEGNNFSTGDWDDSPSRKKTKKKGGWDILQTLVVFLIVVGASFLVAYLTKDQGERSAFLSAGIFLAPAVLMLFGALAVEWLTQHMTPPYSRKAQVIVTLIASVVVFLSGFFGNLIYNLQFVNHDNYIFVLDKSSSMNAMDPFRESEKAIEQMLSQMSGSTNVGLILFSNVVLGEVPIAKLDDAQWEKMRNGLEMARSGTTNFYLPISAALDMLENNPAITKNSTRIIIVTDGDEVESNSSKALKNNYQAVADRCNAGDMTVYCVRLAGDIDASLWEVVNQTDGTGIEISQASEFLAGVSQFGPEHHDLLRDDSAAANVILLIVLLSTGAILGVSLALMLSHRRQKRVQLILSPIMAVCAFVTIKYCVELIGEQWLREAMGFSLLGVVVMRKNRANIHRMKNAKTRGKGASDEPGLSYLDF